MSGDDAWRFAERLLALRDAMRYSATYKLAALLALVDVTAEWTGPGGLAPAVIPAKDVARRSSSCTGLRPSRARQPRGARPAFFSQTAQNDMPAKLASCRSAHGLVARASLDDARGADPAGWAALESDLIAVVIGMPLAKLQRFGEGRRSIEDRFIYDFSWPEEVGRARRRPARLRETGSVTSAPTCVSSWSSSSGCSCDASRRSDIYDRRIEG